MKIDRFRTDDGTYFEGMQCELMSSHHSPDGSAVGLRVMSPHGDELNLVFPGQLIDVMPHVFEKIAKDSQIRREPLSLLG